MNFVRNPVFFLRGNIRLHLTLHIEPAKNNTAEPYIKLPLTPNKLLKTALLYRSAFRIRCPYDEHAVSAAALDGKELIALTVHPHFPFASAHCRSPGHQFFPLFFRHTADDDFAYHLFLVAPYQDATLGRYTRRNQGGKFPEHPLGIRHRHEGEAFIHIRHAGKRVLAAPIFFHEAAV